MPKLQILVREMYYEVGGKIGEKWVCYKCYSLRLDFPPFQPTNPIYPPRSRWLFLTPKLRLRCLSPTLRNTYSLGRTNYQFFQAPTAYGAPSLLLYLSQRIALIYLYAYLPTQAIISLNKGSIYHLSLYKNQHKHTIVQDICTLN